MSIDGPASSGIFPDNSSLAAQCSACKKPDTSASVANPATTDRPTKSLFERRNSKLVSGRQPLNLRLKKHVKSPLERLVDELDRKLFDERFSPIGSPIVSSDGTLKMYRVPCYDQQKIMIHSLRPQTKTDEVYESFASSFWRMVDRENTSVCALANPGGRPIYMPPQQNAQAMKSHPLNVGDCRHFANGICVDVVQIDLLTDLKNTVLEYRQNPQGESPIAREVQLELTKPADWVSNADKTTELADHEPSRTSKMVKVRQIFSCWSDSEPLVPEIAHKIVSRLTSPNLQLHCEGGVNRSPAAAAMILLNKKRESLNARNLLDEVASTIKYIRRCCHNSAAMDRSARITVLHYALSSLGLTAEHMLSSCQTPSMTSPHPSYFQSV